MPLTPSGGSSSYATVADFKLRYDIRALGQLVKDDNTIAPGTALDSDAVIAFELQAASGLVESACQVGSRYNPEDLQSLSGNSRAFLVSIVCDLAYGSLRQRRGYPEEYTPAYKEALRQLQLLQSGESIFPFQQAEDAGLASNRLRSFAEKLRQPWASAHLRRAFGQRIADKYPLQ